MDGESDCDIFIGILEWVTEWDNILDGSFSKSFITNDQSALCILECACDDFGCGCGVMIDEDNDGNGRRDQSFFGA